MPAEGADRDVTGDYRLLAAHYERCLELHGDTHRGVDWPDAADAETRYGVMLDVVRARGGPVTLLDVGCGAAHLLEYLRRQGRDDIVYSGLDISERFVELCRRKFPDVPFVHADLLAGPVELPRYDYVVLNGVLTEKRELSFDEMWSFARALLSRAFELARVGMAFNVLSTRVDWQRDDLFHLPFDTLAEFAAGHLSRHFVIRHDYRLFEYTTYIYR